MIRVFKQPLSALAAVVLLGLLCPLGGRAGMYFVAPGGLDTNQGTFENPFATITRAQQEADPGDTVYLRGGTYTLDNSDLTATNAPWAIVNNLNKNGVSYLAFAGELPVFDFSAVRPAGYRVTAFYVTAADCVFGGFEVIGVQVTIQAGEANNTQSECFRVHGGDRNLFDRLAMHDGMGIGWYLTRGSDNVVTNCDAYSNRGLDSLSMGNVDGFGAHPNSTGGTGNLFTGCRAWFNSDDGFDLINADAAVTIENCWSFYNGYFSDFTSTGGDGHGFKSGGYGRNGSSFPTPVPRHVTRFCLAVRNRVSGFYANHHTGGLDWISNTAWRNRVNYNMLCTLSDNLTDVPGYDHTMKNNLGHDATGSEVTNLGSTNDNDVSYNYFTLPVTVSDGDFAGLDQAQLTQPRQADGSLPDLDLLHLVGGSDLVDAGKDAGFPYEGSAPDLGCFECVPETSLRFEGISPLPGGGVQLRFTGADERAYELRGAPEPTRSPTLWDLLGTGIFTTAAATFDDLEAIGRPTRVYGVHYPVEPISLAPAADTHVRYGTSPGNSYGTSAELGVRQNDTAPRDYFAYIRFDLSSVPGPVTDASFSVTKTGGDTLVNERFRVLGLDAVAGNTAQDWGEASLTFNSAGSEVDTSIYPGPAPGASPFDLARVTDFEEGTPGITETISGGNTVATIAGSALASWLEGRRQDGGLATLLVDFPTGASDKQVRYASRENVGLPGPLLEVEYAPEL